MRIPAVIWALSLPPLLMEGAKAPIIHLLHQRHYWENLGYAKSWAAKHVEESNYIHQFQAILIQTNVETLVFRPYELVNWYYNDFQC